MWLNVPKRNTEAFNIPRLHIGLFILPEPVDLGKINAICYNFGITFSPVEFSRGFTVAVSYYTFFKQNDTANHTSYQWL